MQSQRKARPFNLRFFTRGLIAALAMLALGAAGLSRLPPQVLARLVYYWEISQPPDPTPPPPTLLAPRGALPSGPVGVVEQAQYQGGEFYPVGCGFLLQMEDGRTVGVTTAHSLDLGNSRVLEKVAFSLPNQVAPLVTFEALYGVPGVHFANNNFEMDYVLLKMPDPMPALGSDLMLRPDPRGAPAPGERIVLFSGRGDAQGGPRALKGTVQSVSDTGILAVMDELFEAGGMSGSPLLSEHTGRVVGMTIAATYRRGHTVLGFHSIGSIVGHIESAATFPKMAEYRR